MSLIDISKKKIVDKESNNDPIFAVNNIGNIEDTIRSDPGRKETGEKRTHLSIWGIVFRWKF